MARDTHGSGRYNDQDLSNSSSRHSSSRQYSSSASQAHSQHSARQRSNTYGSDSGQDAQRHSTNSYQQRSSYPQNTNTHRQDRRSASNSYARSSSTITDYNANNYHARKKSTGMSRGKKIALGIVIALVAVVAVGGIAVAKYISDINAEIQSDEVVTSVVDAAADEPYYVLLLGSDSRENWDEEPEGDSVGERTDSIMVVRVDEQAQLVSIISVPRDLRVLYDGDYHKINSIIELGGKDGLIQVLNNVLGIQINYYATIYFDGFEDLVDQLGGVTVEVPEGTSYNGVTVPAGDAVTINGIEALTLARCRHGWPEDEGAYAMGDYQRTLNQRNLIKAIAKKVLEQDVTAMPELIRSLAGCFETNMDVTQLISMAQSMRGMDVDSIDTAQLPIGGATIDGEWCGVMYEDAFEVMAENFTEGNTLMSGLSNFNTDCNGDDIGTDYTDGTYYSYTSYEDIYGVSPLG